MKHSYSNDDTCFSNDVIDEILEEDFNALLNEGSKILHSIEGTLLEEEIFVEFDEFMAMTAYENSDIQLLDDKKPVVQKQRRLNPNMQEVVKKEIVKLLDTGIIYLIADSPWVSPIHCVPKKGGITIVTNENDELVPTRTITGWRENCPVKEGIVLGHKVSSAGLEVDKAKIDVISKLPPPTNIKGVRSFLRHAGFY
ncbi:hypothetical protein Tco_1214452 [Tanacetum coccineum]